jgi:hypothetical protein
VLLLLSFVLPPLLAVALCNKKINCCQFALNKNIHHVMTSDREERIDEVDLDGNTARVKLRRMFLDQIEQVLDKGQVKSTRNRRASTRIFKCRRIERNF